MKNNPINLFLTAFAGCIFLLQLPHRLFSQDFSPAPKDSVTTFSYAAAGTGIACGTDIMLAQQRHDPAFAAREQAMNSAILLRKLVHAGSRTTAVDYTLPVVFHIINKNPSAITDAAVLTALQLMNEAFSATGAFTGGRTDTRIQFCLAKTDPAAGKTSGIVRTKTFLGDYDYDMEAGDMTALGRWDPSKYVNIWVVEDIKSEYMQTFECGVWTRLKMGGYASAGGDIVVAGLGINTLCHETGHYLSLAHTFASRDCANSDCNTSGDRVCDTPPERTITGGYPCASPPNSCSTDTLSGFTVDVPDLPDNFMDYGNGTGCVLGFTEGQAQRMRDFIATGLTGMIGSTVCTEPCTDAITAGFTTNIDYPVIGDVLNLTNVSAGAASYEWLLDGAVVASSTDFTYTVTEKKNYTITLRAYGSTPGCFTSAQFIAQVSCGVTARFWPNKRVIASKDNILLDSVFFTNRSIGAASYQWLFSNNKGMTEQVVSTSFHLNYVFLVPAIYRIRLIATNGACSDTSNYFTLTVYDSSPDAGIVITNAECYSQTKVRVTFWFYNNGYKTVPKNTPVSFYNSNPNSAAAQVIGSTYLLPYAVSGHCSSYLETHLADVGYAGLDTLYAVINDSGTTIPLALPNTPLVESFYTNNTAIRTGFKFHITAAPATSTLAPGQTVTLTPLPVTGGGITSAVWSDITNLSCSNCRPTVFTAPYRGDTVAVKKVMAYSRYGCYDTAFAIIHIPPADDYTIAINSMECAAAGDSMYLQFTICNAYPKSDVPVNLKASFYDGSPLAGGAQLLGSVFINPATSADSCISYTRLIKQSASGTIYAVVNDNGTAIPVVLPNNEGILEKNYANNVNSALYQPPVLAIVPADTSIFRNDSIILSFSSPMIAPVNPVWQAGTGYDLGCTHCVSPQVVVHDSSIVNMEITSRYGCRVKATGKVNVFPPDMKVEILGTACYTNDSTLVRFRICMNNRYPKVFDRIPVSFYDGSGNGKQLYPVFYTPAGATDSCGIYSHIIATPPVAVITAVVNDKGAGNVPAKLYNETDYSNNTNKHTFVPFAVSFNPPVLEINRPATTVLLPQVAGGTATSYKWLWAETLSCYDCASPVANTVSTTQYQVKVKNENSCTDTSMITIKTFTNTTVNIPNAFTPDGNGQNDVFYVIGTRDIKQVKDFSVFNRWGQRVFQASNVPPNDKHFGWDGKLNGVAAVQGTYVYNIILEFTKGTTTAHKGVVLLIR
ncbi:MAG: gliding motility-associated C-terminal domain-containing protein [Chitinophagaceae bacterium]